MNESSEHPYVEWIAREAKRPVVIDPAARERAVVQVMAAVRAEGPIARRSSLVSRRFSLSPMAAGLLAAGLVGIGVIAGGTLNNWGARKGGDLPGRVAVQPPVSHTTDTVVQFVFVGPRASKVSLVGDFNGWDDSKTPMVRAAADGHWTVTLPLAAGRHEYAFVVDGKTWMNDPRAPLAPDNGFGRVNTVKNVPGSTL
jgi:hypothetical protein